MLKLKDKYTKEVVQKMKERFGYRNKIAVPKIEKVVINTSFGRLMSGKTKDEQKKFFTATLNDLGLIAGQRPVLTNAKKSIAAFKIRQGMPIGAAVILRKNRMYDFLERLINISLPRSRDFQGLKEKSVDKNGNLTIGLKEHIIFPEISPEKTKNIFGLEITISTTAKNREAGLELFKLMGFPIKN